METRFVPDADAAWLFYALGSRILAVPGELRAAADAIAALPASGIADVVAGLTSSGVSDEAPFAVLEVHGDGVQVALRGPATVVAGGVTVTGLGASHAVERSLASVESARLTVPGGEWTLRFAPATSVPSGPTAPSPVPPLFEESSDVTAIPELSASIAAVLPPGDADDRTVVVRDRGTPADDRTVVIEELARRRRSTGAATTAPPAPPPTPVPSLELPDGSRHRLDAVVVIGRAPAAPLDAPGSRLVRLGGDGELSRTHARVHVEGGTVVVTDLGSRNGTVVRIPGRAPQRLRDREPTPVLVGTVIDFGGGVEVRVREG